MRAPILTACLVCVLASCGGATEDPATSSRPVSETSVVGSEDPITAPTTSPVAPSPEACAAAGGRCVGVGECGASVGHLHLDVRCGPSPSIACCIMPADSCGGREDFECTDGSATYRPGCRNGRLECPSGTRRGERPSAGGPPS